jgi:hypothetical protein
VPRITICASRFLIHSRRDCAHCLARSEGRRFRPLDLPILIITILIIILFRRIKSVTTFVTEKMWDIHIFDNEWPFSATAKNANRAEIQAGRGSWDLLTSGSNITWH